MNAETILNIQKTAMNYRFLPESSSFAKSRWSLFRNLLNPNAPKGRIVEGRRLRSREWREFKYQGNFEAYRWMNNIPDYHLESYTEAFEKRSLRGFGMQNIFYAKPTECAQFLTSFNQNNLLVDAKNNLIDTQNKRLLGREACKTIYVYTVKGLFLFPDDNEDNFQAHIRHSSMVAGSPVLCAGMISVKEGVIKAIDNNSRHYEPTKKYFDQVIQFLRAKVDVSQIKIKCFDFELPTVKM